MLLATRVALGQTISLVKPETRQNKRGPRPRPVHCTVVSPRWLWNLAAHAGILAGVELSDALVSRYPFVCHCLHRITAGFLCRVQPLVGFLKEFLKRMRLSG